MTGWPEGLAALLAVARRVECHEHIWFNPETKRCEPLPEPGCPECDLVAAVAKVDQELASAVRGAGI